MTDETNTVSEVGGEQQVVDQPNETVTETENQVKEERNVPLAALEAERRKRQEAEAENRFYQQQLALSTQKETAPQEDDDGDDWVTKSEHQKRLQRELSNAKREILEESFVQTNPAAYQQINDDLPGLIKEKPWVKEVIENAPNRWQRAWELLNDFRPKEAPKPQQRDPNAERMVENANKPGSPTSSGKSATLSKVDYMRGIRGTAEWDKYRASLIK